MDIQTANRLYELRKKSGLSQEELADKLGISRQSISKWERAEAAPDTDNLIALAKLYGVSLDELLLGSNGETVKSGRKESVHVSFKDGIHVENQEESVHVSFKNGVHVEGKDKVDVGEEGVWVNGKRVDNCHCEAHRAHREHKSTSIWATMPITFLGVLAFVLWGWLGGAWHISWIALLAIPVYHSLVSAIRNKDASHFAFPVLLAAAYMAMGFEWGLWHPGWVIFLSIPFYYWLVNAFKGGKGGGKADEDENDENDEDESDK